MVQLNAAQNKAVRCTTHPCLVLAGAGSGKTRVITHKIFHLIKEGVPAKNIAAITFTNKAAHEMQERLKHMNHEAWQKTGEQLLDKKTLSQVTVCTFHALGLSILKQEARHLGYKSKFSIFGSDDSQALIKQLSGLDDKAQIRDIQAQISDWKNKLFYDVAQIEKYIEKHIENNIAEKSENKEFFTPIVEQALKLFPLYCQSLKSYQAMDFDDLILQCYLLFKEHPHILNKWQQRLTYILVDEYQDTNFLQYELLKLLVKRPFTQSRFTLVGDDDQSIYAWRGADVDNLKKVVADFEELEVIKLEQNYRSCRKILDAANQIIQHNPRLFDKKLWSELGIGEDIQVHAMNDEDHEAQGTIFRMIAHQFEHKSQWHEYAILYRNNHQSRLFEQILRQENIPYQISGGQSFFDKAEIKDICAYLRLIVNHDDDLAFIRAITTPSRGIAMQTLNTIAALATQMNCSLFHASQMNLLKDQLTPQIRYSLEDFIEHIAHLGRMADELDVHTTLKTLMDWIYYEPYLYEQFDERQAQSKWENVLEFIEWLKKRGTQPEPEPDIQEGFAVNSVFDGGLAGIFQGELNDPLQEIEKEMQQEDSEYTKKPARTLAQLIQGIQLMNILERQNSEAQTGVQLSTLHAAKGLEYNYVFLIGLEEDVLPFRRDEKEAMIEEERRLMYVGITRARKQLAISWCKQRKKGGEKRSTEASRFLEEMGVSWQEKPLTDEERRKNSAYYLEKMRNLFK